jgi:hypothetical protein
LNLYSWRPTYQPPSAASGAPHMSYRCVGPSAVGRCSVTLSPSPHHWSPYNPGSPMTPTLFFSPSRDRNRACFSPPLPRPMPSSGNSPLHHTSTLARPQKGTRHNLLSHRQHCAPEDLSYSTKFHFSPILVNRTTEEAHR